MKILLSVIFVASLIVTPATRALSAENFRVYCPGGQGATTSTNIVVRNFPFSGATLNIKNVKIFNQNGIRVYSGLPEGLESNIKQAMTTGFSTKDVIDVNTGRITVVILFFGEPSSAKQTLAVNLETDSAGRVISKDSIICDSK